MSSNPSNQIRAFERNTKGKIRNICSSVKFLYCAHLSRYVNQTLGSSCDVPENGVGFTNASFKLAVTVTGGGFCGFCITDVDTTTTDDVVTTGAAVITGAAVVTVADVVVTAVVVLVTITDFTSSFTTTAPSFAGALSLLIFDDCPSGVANFARTEDVDSALGRLTGGVPGRFSGKL